MGDRTSEDMSGDEIGGLDDVDGGGGGDGADDMMIDVDLILNILDEPSEPPHNSMEDSMEKTSQADSAPQNGYEMLKGKESRGDAEYSDLLRGSSLYTPEGADSGIGGGSVDYAENSAAVLRVGGDANAELSLQTNSRSYRCFPFQEDQGMERVGVLQPENPNCSTVSSFDEGNFDHGTNVADDLHLSLLLGEPGNQLGPLGGQINSHGMKDALSGSWSDHLGQRLECNGSLPESSYGTSGPQNDTNKPHNVIFTQSGSCYNSDVASELGAHHSAMQLGSNAGRTFFVDSQHGHSAVDFCFDLFPNSDVVKTNERDEMAEFQTESACSVSEFYPADYSILKEMSFKSEGSSYKLPISGNFLRNADDMLMDDQAPVMPEFYPVDYSILKEMNFKSEDISYKLPISGNFLPNADDMVMDDQAPVMPFSYNQSGISNERICIKDEKKHAENTHRGMVWHSFEASNEPTSGNYCCSDETYLFGDENMKQSSSIIFPSTQSWKHAVYTKDEKGDNDVPYTRTQMEGNASSYHIEDANMNFNGSSQYLPRSKSNIRYNQLACKIYEGGGKLIQTKGLGSQLSRISPESIESNSSGSKSLVDDDNFDLCILEDISQPARRKQSMVPFPSNQSPSTTVPFQHSSNGDSVCSTGVSGMRFRPNDERSIFQAALQDLSQPKSEANPPDGLLAVPLMRHQRIALSWMVQKETSSMHCSGGILADDQGLGKTISTIALILKERPTMRVDTAVVKKEEFETLDLDDDNDDDEVTEMKKVADDIHVIPNRSSTKRMSSVSHSKGRPSAGTLVVCPTSVLRQWADELHKKVTSEANLSVLVYHGSNRTKDPFEVAKYDVVLTTYSIVSMEVPKQPLVDGGDDDKGRRESDDVQRLGLSSGKKRKYPPSSGKKGSNSKKGMDSVLLESTRPLAKVGWFRVVLDEAQCIKNHRTQVARACWGLRAKRRWCLSGTPIQNAIDDLYSYFRFLRYDPYAVYGSFCCTIKLPIQRNPTKGYKKLQAVLKTIMLRRTKGTLLDGKPIINLPPKVIELKKVEFTDEERDFYTKLESDSRDQFKEYAAAGTVKQNYVNILLMLLRLRQACDHRFLVRGIDSNSRGELSIEIARKLPQEKQMSLRNCLEASLAICGICNDPPEDAVVSVCGHVFCNQCICEHLSGEDNQCPTSNCKVRLKVSTVFSKAMLNSFLPHQPGQVSSGPDLVEAVNPYAVDNPYESSKIRAALEVLQSLTKPKDCSSTHSSLENSFYVNAASYDKSSGSADSPTNDVDRGNSVVKVIGEKAIVFSQWTKMLDLLEICLKQSSIKYRRLDGTMSVLDRDNAVKEFNTLPEVSVMIMSLKAASLGLNMVAACRVVLLDLWWNPTTEDQAIDRAHRIGQTRPVTVLRLTVKDTVEDRILALQQKKREMVASAFGEDENGGRQTRLTVEDLSYLFMV